jgi:hypothetical protein
MQPSSVNAATMSSRRKPSSWPQHRDNPMKRPLEAHKRGMTEFIGVPKLKGLLRRSQIIYRRLSRHSKGIYMKFIRRSPAIHSVFLQAVYNGFTRHSQGVHKSVIWQCLGIQKLLKSTTQNSSRVHTKFTACICAT